MFLIFLIYFAITCNVSCLQLHQFCYQTSENFLCADTILNYDCGVGLCTQDKHACQSIKLLSILNSQFNNKKDYDSFVHFYELFILNIRECPQYEFQSNDICSIREKCYLKHSLPFRLVNKKVILQKEIACKCTSEFKFKCEKSGYCGKSKIACQMLNNTVLDSINKCTNKKT